MYIGNIKISNILRFHDQSTVDLNFARPNGRYEGWTVLAGRNGSGKTSLLRCIAIAIAGPEIAPRVAPNFIGWRFNQKTEGALSAKFSLERRDIKALLQDLPTPVPGSMIQKDMTLQHTNMNPKGDQVQVTQRVRWTVSIGASWPDDSGVTEDLVREKSEESILSWISFAAGYGPFRHLSTNGSEPQIPVSEDEDSSGILEQAERFATLFREDATLGASIAWLVKMHHRTLEKRRGAANLLDTVLELLSDGLLPEHYQIVRVDSRGLWVRYNGRIFPLRDLSDGHRTVTALVLDITRGLHEFYGRLDVRRTDGTVSVRSPGIVLIDEIDAHLHVSWQKRIGGWLKTHFPRIQFIVTTHSPYICQAADPGGLIRLPGPGEEKGPEHVSDALYNRIVYGSGDDAVLSELFGLDSPYSNRAEDLRRQLVTLEAKVFSGDATKREEDAYHNLSEMLSSSPTARVDEVSARLRRDA